MKNKIIKESAEVISSVSLTAVIIFALCMAFNYGMGYIVLFLTITGIVSYLAYLTLSLDMENKVIRDNIIKEHKKAA